MDQNIGKLLDDRYELLEIIGSGGMSVIYKAYCNRLNRMVAIKVLREEYVEDEDFRHRFRMESQAIAKLSHQNIVSVYDFSRSGDMEYIVMELIDGITLKQYMEKRGRLDWRESLRYITYVMQGLQHAHKHGVVHRDIKPQNIMVLRDGSLKITDFGIACLLDREGANAEGGAMGSVHYISPEQARGEHVTAKSDIYSAGVLLYEMLTGRLPYVADTPLEVAIQHISSMPLMPREYNREIPPALEAICMKAMTADIEGRYQSAEEMLDDLEKFRKNPKMEKSLITESLPEKEPDEPTTPLPAAEVSNFEETIRRNRETKRNGDGEKETPSRADGTGTKKRVLLCVGIAAVAILSLLLVGKLLLSSFSDGGGETYAVPRLIGMTEEEAAQAEGVKDIFTVRVVGGRSSTEYAEGTIIEQDPDRGSRKKAGSVIEVYLSTGVESDQMPKLVGEDYQTARVRLLNMNLDLQIEEPDSVYSDEIPEGRIVSTIPDAGETLEKGNTVYIVVSLGAEPVPVTVISFLGETEEAARKKAEELGLSVGESEIRDDAEQEEGTVIGQSIEAGGVVDSGTEISFVISGGPPAGSATRRYSLPWWSDENVHVVIECNDETVYDEVVSSSMGGVSYTFTGKGTAHVKVYFDDVLTKEEDIELN